MIYKLCPRCQTTIEETKKYCDRCTKEVEKEKAEYHRNYDKNIRDRKYTEFYHSPEWEMLRKTVLICYHYLDLYCLFINKQIVTANTSHHITTLKDDWHKRFEFTNQFPCSSETHSLIHQLYEKEKEQTQKLLWSLLKKFKEQFSKR